MALHNQGAAFAAGATARLPFVDQGPPHDFAIGAYGCLEYGEESDGGRSAAFRAMNHRVLIQQALVARALLEGKRDRL
jgi:hypothetical protein